MTNTIEVVTPVLLSTDIATLIASNPDMASKLQPVEGSELPALQGDYNAALETQFGTAIADKQKEADELGVSLVQKDLAVMSLAVAAGISITRDTHTKAQLTSEALANLIAVQENAPVISELADLKGAWFDDFGIAYYSQMSPEDFATMVNPNLIGKTPIVSNPKGRPATKRAVDNAMRNMFRDVVALYAENALRRNLIEVDGEWQIVSGDLLTLANDAIEEDSKIKKAALVEDKESKAKLIEDDKLASAVALYITAGKAGRDLPATLTGAGFTAMTVAIASWLDGLSKTNVNVAKLLSLSDDS